MTIAAHNAAHPRPGAPAARPKRKGTARDLLAQFAPGMTLPPAAGGDG